MRRDTQIIKYLHFQRMPKRTSKILVLGQRKDSFSKQYSDSWLAPLRINLSSFYICLNLLGCCNNRSLFLIFLEVKKSTIKAPAAPVSGEGLTTGSQLAIFSLCPHMAESVREISGISFTRALVPFIGLYSHGLIISQKVPHHQIPSHWVLGLNRNFGGTQTFSL